MMAEHGEERKTPHQRPRNYRHRGGGGEQSLVPHVGQERVAHQIGDGNRYQARQAIYGDAQCGDVGGDTIGGVGEEGGVEENLQDPLGKEGRPQDGAGDVDEGQHDDGEDVENAGNPQHRSSVDHVQGAPNSGRRSRAASADIEYAMPIPASLIPSC
jgi:hypothetical protein